LGMFCTFYAAFKIKNRLEESYTWFDRLFPMIIPHPILILINYLAVNIELFWGTFSIQIS